MHALHDLIHGKFDIVIWELYGNIIDKLETLFSQNEVIR